MNILLDIINNLRSVEENCLKIRQFGVTDIIMISEMLSSCMFIVIWRLLIKQFSILAVLVRKPNEYEKEFSIDRIIVDNYGYIRSTTIHY